MSKLPAGFTEKHLPGAEGTMMFGVPITELDKDDLLAMIVHQRKSHVSDMEQKSREFSLLNDTRRTGSG